MLRHLIRKRTTSTKAILTVAALAAAIPVAAWSVATRRSGDEIAPAAQAQAATADHPIEARRSADFAAMQTFRPGYAFWQHIFTIPDGSIADGSAVDGRLLATFPAKGVWTREAQWSDPAMAAILGDQQLARKLRERRQQVALLRQTHVVLGDCGCHEVTAPPDGQSLLRAGAGHALRPGHRGLDQRRHRDGRVSEETLADWIRAHSSKSR